MSALAFASSLGLADLFGEHKDSVALVVLNGAPSRFLPFVWGRSSLQVIADGAANSLLSLSLSFDQSAIVGDGDSISPSALLFFSEKGVPIHLDPADQDCNDLVKCLRWIKSNKPSATATSVYIVGAFGGRFDHEAANIAALFAEDLRCAFKQMVLIGEDSLALLVPAGGKCTIDVVSPLEGPKCGLLPIGGPSDVTSSGLHWDLASGTRLAFGGMISTSNWIEAVYPHPPHGDENKPKGAGEKDESALCVHEGAVTIETSAPIVWTTQLHWARLISSYDCHGPKP